MNEASNSEEIQQIPQSGEIPVGSVDQISLALLEGLKPLQDVMLWHPLKNNSVMAIIGPNGAGKTSMLNVINGFLPSPTGPDPFQGASSKANASA